MQSKNEAEKKYAGFAKKYELPSFKELNQEFEISDLEENGFLLRRINRKIADKMDFYTTVIEEILQPDTSNIYAMHETRFFDEKQKKDMYELYKRLMNINRQLLQLAIKKDEGDDAQFLSDFFKEWKTIKQELIKYLDIMKNSWHSDIESKESVEYMG